MNIICPKCNSENVEVVEYLGTKCIICKDCDYDEREELEQVPEQRSSQKAKGHYTPYKTGGKSRTNK